MAEEDENSEEIEIPGTGRNRLIVAIFILNVLALLLGGGAVAFVVMNSPGQADAEEDDDEAAEVTDLGPLVELNSFVVNLDEPSSSHYIRAGFQLELTSAEAEARVEERTVPIRSAILLHLSSLTVEDTSGRDNRDALLDRLREIANEQIGAELVRNIYVTEFVVR